MSDAMSRAMAAMDKWVEDVREQNGKVRFKDASLMMLAGYLTGIPSTDPDFEERAKPIVEGMLAAQNRHQRDGHILYNRRRQQALSQVYEALGGDPASVA